MNYKKVENKLKELGYKKGVDNYTFHKIIKGFTLLITVHPTMLILINPVVSVDRDIREQVDIDNLQIALNWLKNDVKKIKEFIND